METAAGEYPRGVLAKYVKLVGRRAMAR